MHGHFTTPFSGGSPPSESGIRNVYSAGESEILSRIGEEDASLPISQENLEILLGEGSVISQGLSNLAIATEMPVNLAEGTTESLAMAISGETLKVTPSGTSLPVSGDVGVTKLPRCGAGRGNNPASGDAFWTDYAFWTHHDCGNGSCRDCGRTQPDNRR